MKKKHLSIIAIALLFTVTLTACDGKTTTIETEVPQKTVETTVAEPMEITVEDLKPLADKGVIVGVQDIKVTEGTKMNLVDSVVIDKKIVTNITCKDNTNYSKAGTYDAVYTITFDSDVLNKFIKDNSLKLNFTVDDDADTVRVKVKVTVDIITKEKADKAIENGDKSVVTEETVGNVQKENQETAKNNGNSNTVSDGSITHDEPAKPTEKPAKPSKPANPAKPAKPAEKPHQHNFDYEVSVVTQPTCTSAGVERHTCSCGEYKDKSIPAHGHAWHHYDEEGHSEDITEDIFEWRTICGGCGKDFGPGEAGANAAGEHIMAEFGDACENYHAERRKVGTKVVDRKWVVDKAAYDECDICHERK